MPRLMDLLSEKDRAKVKQWAEERNSPLYEPKIPPYLYTIAEVATRFGWEAAKDVMRGYYESKNLTTGEPETIILTTEFMIGLCKAAQQIRYNDLLTDGDVQVRANMAAASKDPSKSFRENFREYERLAKKE